MGVEDVAGAIGSFVDGGVVKDDGVPIPTHVYVKFDGVNGQGEGIAKSGECIFRGKMRASAMGNSLNVVTHRWCSTSPLDRKTMCYTAPILPRKRLKNGRSGVTCLLYTYASALRRKDMAI